MCETALGNGVCLGKHTSTMSSPVAIFITKCATTVGARSYDYSSLDSVFDNGTGFVYSGQKNGGENFKLLRAIDRQEKFYVYFRAKKNQPFFFMGSTRDVAAPFVDDPSDNFQIMMSGDGMYPNSIKSNPLMTNKQNALVDFMKRNGVSGTPSGINLMKGFYLLNEVVDPSTFESAPVDIKKAYNWDIHIPFSTARLVYC